MQTNPITVLRTLWPALLLGSIATLSIVAQAARNDFRNPLEGVLITLYLISLLTILSYYGLIRPTKTFLHTRSSWVRRGWLLSIPLFGGLLISILPFAPARPFTPTPFSVTITATGTRNPQAEGPEVWVSGIQQGTEPLALTLFEHDQAWTVRDGMLSTSGQEPSPLRLQSAGDPLITIELLHHPWSGIATVQVNQEMREIDLYAEEFAVRPYSFTVAYTAAQQLQLGVIYTLQVLTLGSVAMLIILRFVGKRS